MAKLPSTSLVFTLRDLAPVVCLAVPPRSVLVAASLISLGRGVVLFSNRRTGLLLRLRADTRTAVRETTGGGSTLNFIKAPAKGTHRFSL
jgi:hypothetical protein